MPMRIAWLVLLAVACKKDDPKDKAKAALDTESFWPDAPRVESATSKRALRYQAENIKRYTLAIDIASDPDSDVKISGDMDVTLAFEPAAVPNERGARIEKLTLDMNAAGQAMNMRLDKDELVIAQGAEKQTVRRGEPGILDVAEIVDKPFTTLVVSADNKITFRANKDHSFTMLGGDMLDTALVLFPDLPAGETAAGHAWSVKRNVALGSGVGRADVTYNFKYLGDGKCPTGGATCAILQFDADSPKTEVETPGGSAEVSYGFAGKIYFDTAKGALDESRVKMHMVAKVRGINMPIGATYILKPS
jgi:hypothetical protein